MNEIREKFESLINSSTKIAITSHLRPDPDAFFSATALLHYLKTYLHKDVDVIFESSQSLENDDSPYSNDVIWDVSLPEKLIEYDTVIFLDGSEQSRFSHHPLKEVLESKTTICFDHHLTTPDIPYSLYYCDNNLASTSHLLGELVIKKDILLKDRQLAEMILWSVMGDTGSLQFVDKKRVAVLQFVASLIAQYDFSVEQLSMQLSTCNQLDLVIIQNYLKNCTFIELQSGIKLMYSYPDDNLADTLGITPDRLKSGIATFQYLFLRKVKDYLWGFTVNPSVNEYGISFRSAKTGYNVEKISRELFGGGGSLQAAGGKIVGKFSSNKAVAEEVIRILNSTFIEPLDSVE